MHRRQELAWHAGDDRPLDFEIYDPLPDEPDAPDLASPVDLSAAAEIRFALAAKATDATPLVEKTLSGGKITVLGANSNVVRVDLDKADTASLAPGRYYYELEVAESAANNWTGPHGTMVIHASLLK